jgi:metal-responsive CopG/Arc/MetJ family transcriptional regulator
MAERKFSCHKTIKEDNQDEQETEHCIGSILYMNKNAKRCVEKSLAELQEKFRGSEIQNEILNTMEFLEHHKDAKKLY